MFTTLRWRLFAAFGLVVLLTTLLNSFLSIDATNNRFAALTAAEGQERATELAPLVEASYLLVGDWARIEEPFFAEFPEEHTLTLATDWFALVAEVLALDEETLLAEMDMLGSLTAVSLHHNLPPDQLATIIYEAEQTNLETAVFAGYLTPEEASEMSQYLPTEIDFFLNDDTFSSYPAWDEAVAATLNLSPADLTAARLNGRSYRSLATEQALPIEQLTQTIFAYEQSTYPTQQLSNAEQLWHLHDLIVTARSYVTDETSLHIEEAHEIGEDMLADSLLFGDERLLIANENGRIVYDSLNQLHDQPLDNTLASEGVPLWDFQRGQPLGTIVVATGEGFYDASQLAFLESVTQSALISGLVAGVGALIVGLFIAQRITRPVTALTQAAKELASGSSVARLPVRSHDELGQMSATFNEMANAIETQQQLRSRLINDISHELNTPLTLIQLELEGLKDGMQSPEQTAVQVQREIGLLHNLINDLALVANLEGDGIVLAEAAIDWAMFLETAVSRWQPQAEAKGITLHLTIQPNLPPVTADARRLNQALSNLIGNALQHTPAGGQVTIHSHSQQHQLITHIQDSGIGIPAADLPHIFDRFYRTDRSRSRRSGGRGLGLAIVRQIIEQHGGRVWVTSEPDQGSTFGFELPLG